jgi:MazG family protein
MTPFDALVEIVAKLRSEKGCPWDREQSPKTMRPYLLEETHEVIEAIESENPSALKQELGDLLFQIVLISQMQSEAGHFDMEDVCHAIGEKMIRRHPHVFDPEHIPLDDEGSVGAWEARKAKERNAEASMMDGVPAALPALLRAHRVGEKVSKLGFDWPTIQGVHAKIAEEMAELDQAIANNDPEEIEAEFGDVLMSVASLGRFLGQDPESALRGANARFAWRFKQVEGLARKGGHDLHAMDLPGLEALWDQAKKLEALEKASPNSTSHPKNEA